MLKRKSRACLRFLLTATLVIGIRAQDRSSLPAFEVAAIKPHNPADPGGGFGFQHGRLTISNTWLKILVMTVYALVAAKNGPKLQRSAPDAQYSMRMGPEGMSATKMSIHTLADTLAGYVSRSVIDKTGLQGDFDFKFDWSPQDPNSPSIFTALQEQLGLKLESEKGPVEFLVIDHAEKPSEN
ncbi:MAG: TIGR03435 family protein [Acidobacteriia bacterium]|nr:TIGR03435 family protein [Terriglobia bacterium]